MCVCTLCICPNASTQAYVCDEGKLSSTRFKSLRCFKDGTSLLQCDLETGHRHQIRAHLAFLGIPIANDTTYGVRASIVILYCSSCPFTILLMMLNFFLF